MNVFYNIPYILMVLMVQNNVYEILTRSFLIGVELSTF